MNRLREYRTGTVCGLLFVSLVTLARAQISDNGVPVLTMASQVRQLTPEQAASGYRVKIRGVVTGDVPAPDFFVQDSTAGVFVEGNPTLAPLHHFGDLVDLVGVTGPGKFAPVVREQAITILGHGSLPDARTYSFHELSAGQMDSQWVKVRGVVRSISIDKTSWKELTAAMRIASGDGEFIARVPIDREQDLSSWIDSEVVIEGVCGSLFTAQRQLSGILFYIPRLSFMSIATPAPEVPITALLRFSPGVGGEHRVRVRGLVEFQQSDKTLYLQSESRGLRVVSQQISVFEPGDIVEVAGWPAVGESAPILTDAVFRRVGHAQPPSPVKFQLNAPWERYDGALVSIEATLLQQQRVGDGIRLLLKAGENLFDANLATNGTDHVLRNTPPNSELLLTGICLVRDGGLWSVPQSFRILLRSPADIQVLRAASWWTLPHTLWMLGITLGVLLAVMVWVVVLGRRVREQMAVIRQKLQNGAVLEERNRIARELHDTLEQELVGITMQLDLAVDCLKDSPSVAKTALETARNMSRRSMVEARRSVWDLRCHLLENGDLVSALNEVIRPLISSDGPEFSLQTLGTPVRMPASVEMNLLRIGQEAITNAVKHSGARCVQTTLLYDSEAVRLSVSDDGDGFQPAGHASTGHFGLLDMRERAQSMGSVLEVESHVGRGTKLSVLISLKVSASDESIEAHTNSGG